MSSTQVGHPRATIATGGTTVQVNLGKNALCGVYVPDTFNGTTLDFAHVFGGVTYPVRDIDGNAIQISGIGSLPGFYALNPADFPCVEELLITAGATQTTTPTALILLTRDVD